MRTLSRPGDVALFDYFLEITPLFSLAESARPAAGELADVALQVLVQQFHGLVGAWPWDLVGPLGGKVSHSP
jgi:hypothetical protein